MMKNDPTRDTRDNIRDTRDNIRDTPRDHLKDHIHTLSARERDQAREAELEQLSEAALTRSIFKTTFCNAIQRRHIKNHQKSITTFEQAFSTIKSATGVSDIEEMVRIFIKLEERNYSHLVGIFI